MQRTLKLHLLNLLKDSHVVLQAVYWSCQTACHSVPNPATTCSWLGGPMECRMATSICTRQMSGLLFDRSQKESRCSWVLHKRPNSARPWNALPIGIVYPPFRALVRDLDFNRYLTSINCQSIFVKFVLVVHRALSVFFLYLFVE